MEITRPQTARRWSRRAVAAAGVAVGASAIAFGLCAAAHADAIPDVLAAAQVPLTDVLIAIDRAPSALDPAVMAVLSGQGSFIDSQEEFLTLLQSVQVSLATDNADEFADVDKLLITANESVLDHTTAFLSAVELEGPIAQFFAGADLINADLSTVVTDFEVVLGTIATDYFGSGSGDLAGLLLS